MNKITNIIDKTDRVWIYIDGQYCTSIRSRTFKAMNLNIGDEIDCESLKENENFFWKNQYSNSWLEEKVRLERATALITYYTSNLYVKTTGFGADSEKFIARHAETSGEPDLTICSKSDNSIRLYLEVTGTANMRGNDFWVRLDKLHYAQNNPEKDVWILLHFQKPKERFIFIKPVIEKKYQVTIKTIRGADEHFVIFDDTSEEVISMKDFANYIKKLDY